MFTDSGGSKGWSVVCTIPVKVRFGRGVFMKMNTEEFVGGGEPPDFTASYMKEAGEE